MLDLIISALGLIPSQDRYRDEFRLDARRVAKIILIGAVLFILVIGLIGLGLRVAS